MAWEIAEIAEIAGIADIARDRKSKRAYRRLARMAADRKGRVLPLINADMLIGKPGVKWVSPGLNRIRLLES